VAAVCADDDPTDELDDDMPAEEGRYDEEPAPAGEEAAESGGEG
jgi:hypothetical protein